MNGTVTPTLDATLPLLVYNVTGQAQPVEALVDTGFNGHLTLPVALIAALRLTWVNRHRARLADGRVVFVDVYAAVVDWDGQPRSVVVEAADGEPLLGMKLLRGHVLTIEVVGGGAVTIQPIP